MFTSIKNFFRIEPKNKNFENLILHAITSFFKIYTSIIASEIKLIKFRIDDGIFEITWKRNFYANAVNMNEKCNFSHFLIFFWKNAKCVNFNVFKFYNKNSIWWEKSEKIYFSQFSWNLRKPQKSHFDRVIM